TAPTAAQADVLSIFSDAYTDLAGSDFDPNWGQETDATIETYAGNEVLQYKNLNYQGLQYTQSDVSGYTKLHLDYWTADATTINVSLISVGPLENPVALTVTTGSWQSVDINLSEYTTPNLSEVFQLKTDGDGTVILDNIYFY
ncbi:MAG: glycoside hydrolase family 16 protein, partial [Flavobacteriaceae bacterium]|nr:glycoside hydrolase family 16 protein [Candidatus Arcticimaribacter sp.]